MNRGGIRVLQSRTAFEGIRILCKISALSASRKPKAQGRYLPFAAVLSGPAAAVAAPRLIDEQAAVEDPAVALVADRAVSE